MRTPRIAGFILFALAASVATPAFAADLSDGTCGSSSARNELAEFGSDLHAIFQKAGDVLYDTAAESVGVIELTGIRYPVKAYQEQVSPTLWRGSRLDGVAAFQDLKSRGFKATVDLTLEGTGDARFAPEAGLKTYNVPTLDNAHPTEAQMVDFLNFVTDPANQPVYIHCEAGVGRTSIATAVYQMAVLGMSPAAALAGAEAHGDHVPNQLAFIQKFGADLHAGKIPGYPAPRE